MASSLNTLKFLPDAHGNLISGKERIYLNDNETAINFARYNDIAIERALK